VFLSALLLYSSTDVVIIARSDGIPNMTTVDARPTFTGVIGNAKSTIRANPILVSFFDVAGGLYHVERQICFFAVHFQDLAGHRNAILVLVLAVFPRHELLRNEPLEFRVKHLDDKAACNLVDQHGFSLVQNSMSIASMQMEPHDCR
jgi:hypothetical protein